MHHVGGMHVEDTTENLVEEVLDVFISQFLKEKAKYLKKFRIYKESQMKTMKI